ERFDDERHTARAVTLVADLVVVLGVAALPLLDRALDVVLRHRLLLGGKDGGAKARIVIGIGKTALGGDGDFAGEFGEELGALLILLAFAEHDVLELTM